MFSPSDQKRLSDARALLREARRLSAIGLDEAQRQLRAIHDSCRDDAGGLEALKAELTGAMTAEQGGLEQAVREQAEHVERFRRLVIQQIQSHASIAALALEMTDNVLGLMGQLEKITLTARMLSYNTQIEASRLGALGATFDVLAASMNDLNGQIASATGAIRDLLGRLRFIIEQLAQASEAAQQTVEEETARVVDSMENVKGAYIHVQGVAVGTLGRSVTHVRSLQESANVALAQLKANGRLAHILSHVDELITVAPRESV